MFPLQQATTPTQAQAHLSRYLGDPKRLESTNNIKNFQPATKQVKGASVQNTYGYIDYVAVILQPLALPSWCAESRGSLYSRCQTRAVMPWWRKSVRGFSLYSEDLLNSKGNAQLIMTRCSNTSSSPINNKLQRIDGSLSSPISAVFSSDSRLL